MPAASRRAAPLPPEERRAAILTATIPLLREHGLRVSTRQIAAAAGVAEGTLYRVFPDKKSLLDAAVQSAFSPEPLLAELAAVDGSLPLDERLLVIVNLLQRRLNSIIELMTVVGMHRPPGDGAPGPGRGVRPPRATAHGEFIDAVAALLETDRDALTTTPRKVARMLRLLTFAGTHPGITDGDPLTAEEIVSVVLDGVRLRGSDTCLSPDSPTPLVAERALPRKRNRSNTRSHGKEA